MAFRHGSNSFISVDGSDVSTFTDSATAAHTQDTAEVTAFGDDDKEFIAGLRDGNFSLSGHWDVTADAALIGTFDGGTVVIIYGPEGNAGGSVEYTATCIVTSYSQSSPVGDKVSWSADFQRTGALARSTF